MLRRTFLKWLGITPAADKLSFAPPAKKFVSVLMAEITETGSGTYPFEKGMKVEVDEAAKEAYCKQHGIGYRDRSWFVIVKTPDGKGRFLPVRSIRLFSVKKEVK